MTPEKVLTGMIAGLAAGAVLGILFAPDKGTETRKKIADMGTQFGDTLINGLNSFTDAVSNKYERIKEDTSELLVNGKGNFQSLKDEDEMQPSIL